MVNQKLGVIPGSVPALGRFPSGCRFRGRCASESARCAEPPPVTPVSAERTVKCWHPAGSDGDVDAPEVADVAH